MTTRFAKAPLAAVAIVPVVLAATLAQATPLGGDDLKSLVAGKRIYLKVPFGGEFPLYYQANGTVSGDGTALGLGKYLAPKETGKWWIQGDNLCQQWPTWYKGKVTCFTIEKTGDSTLNWHRDDGKSGIARIDG